MCTAREGHRACTNIADVRDGPWDHFAGIHARRGRPGPGAATHVRRRGARGLRAAVVPRRHGGAIRRRDSSYPYARDVGVGSGHRA